MKITPRSQVWRRVVSILPSTVKLDLANGATSRCAIGVSGCASIYPSAGRKELASCYESAKTNFPPRSSDLPGLPRRHDKANVLRRHHNVLRRLHVAAPPLPRSSSQPGRRILNKESSVISK